MRYAWLLYVLLLGGSIYGSARYFGFYLNISDSMPKGIYKQVDIAAVRGDLATSCLSPRIATYGLQRGYLVPGQYPTGIRPVMKRIVAVPGDHVEVKNGHLVINHTPESALTLQSVDSRGRPLQIFYASISYNLKKDQYILASNHVYNSWDSRYWGPVPIKEAVVPVWIF